MPAHSLDTDTPLFDRLASVPTIQQTRASVVVLLWLFCEILTEPRELAKQVSASPVLQGTYASRHLDHA